MLTKMHACFQFASPCTDGSMDLCSVYFLDPFVTNEIHVYPVTWTNSIALQLVLSGVKFTSFNRKYTLNKL